MVVQRNLPRRIFFLVKNTKHRAGVAGAQGQHIEPVVKVGVVFPVVVEEDVKGVGREEKLVGAVVEFLPTQIPEVGAYLAAVEGFVQVEQADLYAFGAFVGCVWDLVRGVY